MGQQNTNKESFGYRIGHAHFVLRSALDRRFAQAGYCVTTEQWRVLKLVDGKDGTALHVIEEKLGKRQSSISKLVARMQEHGLVESVPGCEDKRTRMVRLTDHGSRILGFLNNIAERNLEVALKGIPREKIDSCVEVLMRAERNIEEFEENQQQNLKIGE